MNRRKTGAAQPFKVLTERHKICYNADMKLKRIVLPALKFFLLAAGTVIALICDILNNEVTPLFISVVNLLSMVALVFLLLIVVIEIVACMKLAGSTVHTVIIAATLFFYYLCSTDVINTFGSIGLNFHKEAADIFSLIFFMAFVLSTVHFFNYLYNLKLPVWGHLLSLFVVTVCALLYSMLQYYSLQYIPFFLFGVSSVAVLILISFKICRDGRDNFTYYATTLIVCAAYGAQNVYVLDKCDLISVSTQGYTLVYMFFIILTFLTIYFYFIIRTARAALKASEYRLQLNTLKSEILREQIKPHFVFNSLTTIKSLYHKDVTEGDHAMNLFSRHLRSNVEAADTDLIPFERELDNIQNYTELENARYDKKFNIIFNIDFTDFFVPVLSLQPFVENAIKYSKVNDKPDGYIEISTCENGDEVILQITDNGVGFDESDIKENSFGIRNSRERFRLLINAEIEIESKKNVGTKVTIHIRNPLADVRKRAKEY